MTGAAGASGRGPLMASPWGEAVERSETDEGAAMDQRDGYMPPHPALRATFPPVGGRPGERAHTVRPYSDAGPSSVMARRAAGPTRQSVFPSGKDGFPRPLRGLGMTVGGGPKK